MHIHLQNITKKYGDLTVLNNVSLEITTSEIIAVVGASGAGKSTLLNILGTLDKPDSGNYFFNEGDVLKFNNQTLSEFRNKNIGFVFQFHHLLNEFTALENVCIPGYIAKRNTNEVKQIANELLATLGLAEKAENKPKQLSGGEQQRVAIARALINNPDIILADEPSGNLDSTNATELHKLFRKLQNEFGKTIIVVTHNEELAKIADRKLMIRDGSIV